MLGFGFATGKIPFINVKYFEEVIQEWLRDPEDNIKALHIGIEEGTKIINKK